MWAKVIITEIFKADFSMVVCPFCDQYSPVIKQTNVFPWTDVFFKNDCQQKILIYKHHVIPRQGDTKNIVIS